MSREYPYLRIFIFLCATVMSVLPAISIQNPRLSTMDIFRIRLNESSASNVGEVRFGLWSFCLHRTSLEGNDTICDTFSPCDSSGSLRLCSNQKYGYELTMTSSGENASSKSMSPAWTRPFVAHAAVAIMMTACFLLQIINHPSAMMYLITAVISAVTFFCDIAVSYHLKALVKELNGMGLGEKYLVGPGFVLQLLSSIWLVLELFWMLCIDDETDAQTLPTSSRQQAHSSSSASQSSRMQELKPDFFPSRSPSPIPRPKSARTKPHRKATDGLPGKECPICWERKTSLSELPCKHIFCTECISTSVGLYRRCPLCNRQANRFDVDRVSVLSFV